MLVPIRFKNTYAPYRCGEVAGFPQEQADDLVAQGMAAYVVKGLPNEVAAEAPEEAQPEKPKRRRRLRRKPKE